MIVVTGGAGFIGSNVVAALNARGHDDIVVVDDLTTGEKFRNLTDCAIADYRDKDEYLAALQGAAERERRPEVVFHMGACSDTTESDGRYMMASNYEYSKRVLAYCATQRVPLVYASSAAVYGRREGCREGPECENPLNVYAWSKLVFDNYVRRLLPRLGTAVAGLRYFNVYGPRERHKGSMASVVHHFHHQLLEHGRVRLFAGSHGYGDGEQRRDFVHVDDAVRATCWFAEHPECSGIFNVGTGRSRSFNDVARAVIAWHGHGEIEYVPFPETLREAYQSHTEADLGALRAAGYDGAFRDLEAGVSAYLDSLCARAAS